MEKDLKEQYGEELGSAIEDVEKELETLSGDTFEAFSEVSKELLDKFLIKNSCNPSAAFKEQMQTPFAIARYLILLVQQKENIEIIDSLLKTLLEKTNVNYNIYEDFSNQICFSKEPELNSEEKPQCLVLKYRIDKETEKVIFTLPGNNWGWDIDNSQLLSILTNKTINTIGKSNTKTYSGEDVCLTINGLTITIKKSN